MIYNARRKLGILIAVNEGNIEQQMIIDIPLMSKTPLDRTKNSLS